MESSVAYQENHTDHHIVKCVVVGDTGVGKTRLICARACSMTFTLGQLMQTHVPTVWAIDHYRKDKSVYEKSWCTVDGVSVSLQLWDTFGYHDKDRKFAYGKADVVLVCFSTVRPRSLRNVIHHWLPEIRHHTTHGTPLVLCGTQIDLRYLYNDPEFLNLNKGPFFRQITSEDIIPPQEGRRVAEEINALCYYETSVLIPYGVAHVFENVIRVGLAYKRDKHFWSLLNNSFRRVGRPRAQEPFMPPQPSTPTAAVPASCWREDMDKLYVDGSAPYSDLVFRTRQGDAVDAHRIVVLAALPGLQQLIAGGRLSGSGAGGRAARPRSVTGSNSSGSDCWEAGPRPEQHGKDCCPETVCLLTDGDPSRAADALNELCQTPEAGASVEHPVFGSVQYNDVTVDPRQQTVIGLKDNVSVAAFRHVLHFMYTWNLRDKVIESRDLLVEIRNIAELLEFSVLVRYVENILHGEHYINDSLGKAAIKAHQERLKDLGLKQGICADVAFEVDGSKISGHKALLMVRSDMMACMFSNNFLESSADMVPFPGVRKKIFVHLLQYLYTDHLVKLLTSELIELIELANRLCLPRVQAIAEEMIISQLTTLITTGQEIFEEVAGLLEPAQLHNATQLAAWCLWYLSCNYVQLYKKHSKLKQGLSPENQILLSKNRWPPVWYLKERDYYEKCQLDYERARKVQRTYIFRQSSEDSGDVGCLGFCTRRKRKIRYEHKPKGAVCV